MTADDIDLRTLSGLHSSLLLFMEGKWRAMEVVGVICWPQFLTWSKQNQEYSLLHLILKNKPSCILESDVVYFTEKRSGHFISI